ncbi:MAG: 50S ribosomal protein L23 [Candidatus Moraniibacteriota bacterium]
MGIFDKILGKTEEKKEEPEKKAPVVKAEKKTEAKGEEKKPASAKAEKKEDKPVKKAKIAKAEKPKKEIAKRKVAKKEENIAHKILLENLISEKATILASQNKYVFKVDKYAGKFQIKEAIEGYYGVQVVSVNTIRISPKKRIQGRTIGWKKGFKKAVVTLRQGDTIGVVEGV